MGEAVRRTAEAEDGMHGNDSVSSTTTDGGRRQSRSGGAGRNLPTGRALVGGLLVTMAAVVVFAAYAGAQERPTTSVVVARHDLDPGERLTADDVEAREVAVPAEVADRSFPDVGVVVGALTLGPIAAGELVQEGSVRTTDDGSGPQFSFPVDRERALAGDVRPGEAVDLLATFGSGSDARTEVLARRARVLHVQETRNGTLGSSGRLVLTVGLASASEVIDVAHASQVAVITLVRPSSGDASTVPGPSGSSGAPAPTTSTTTGGGRP
jgi:Flp pilus assembly protein CpaB